MKAIDELNFPEEIRYSGDHEWVKMEMGAAKIGISDYAQDQLGDIVFVELPQVGDNFNKGDEFGTVESVKAVSELYMPISGKITAVNITLEDSPDLVNIQPYHDGWMVEATPEDPSELETLMTKADYLKSLKEAD